MRILARLQEMAGSEILSIIPASEYERVKRTDPKPLFKAFVVGHEGISSGRVEGGGDFVKRWLASAIQKLHDKLKFGLKVFHNHGETNAHAGRSPIGEIVGKALKFIDDRMSAVAVAYIRPRYRHLPLDIASIEADVRLSEEGGIYDVDVGEVTGVALGSSAISRPGFAGATLLAQIQEFADGRSRNPSHGGGSMEYEEITLDVIRQAVKAKNIQPSDVFDAGSLTKDPIVLGYVDTARKQAYGGGRAHLDRTEEEFDKQKKEWEKKEADYQKKLKEQDASLAKGKVPELFEKISGQRKFTEQQKKFILARLPKFSPADPAKAEEELSRHLDSEIEEHKREAELFGVKLETAPADGGDTKKPGGEPEPAKAKPEGEQKYLDPAFNPFIAKGD